MCSIRCAVLIDVIFTTDVFYLDNAVVDLRGVLLVCAPLRSKMFSISCIFFGKFGKIIGRRPFPGGLAPPPTENPGSAPEVD